MRWQFQVSIALSAVCVFVSGAQISDARAHSPVGFSNLGQAVLAATPGLRDRVRYNRRRSTEQEEASALFEEAQYELDSGQPDAARRVFEELVSRFPDTEEALRAQRHLARLYRGKAGDASRRSAARRPADYARRPRGDRRSSPARPRSSATPGLQPDRKLQNQLLRNVGDRVFFAPNSAELGAKARLALRRQARWLRSHKDIIIQVVGHSDEAVSRDDNIVLSLQRAEAVRNRLVEEGVDKTRVRINGLGRAERIAICNSSACAAQNRRAVTQVLRPTSRATRLRPSSWSGDRR